MSGDTIAYQRDHDLVSGLDYVPYFGIEVDLDDRKAVIEHCCMLYEKRNDALRDPISGGWSFIANISPVSRETPPPDNARPLPHFARTGGYFRFTLIEGLQTMEEYDTPTFHHSQVWVAQVTGIQDDGVHEDDEETVVVKIVQASLIPAPDGNRRNPWEINSSARQLACSEDLFYDCFPGEQGIQIPWYFGKFQVKMPNGEEAYVLIMEQIKGCTLPDWLATYAAANTSGKAKRLQSLKDVILSIHDAYDALSQAGMYHELGSLEDVIIRCYPYSDLISD
ncbi:hypothetical protein BDZ89DRAFT_1067459 [Hymenopellis radicata]|nr:hypothetical protein BDZ89DRAFT_1067459 [Hymenopellis radicata]